MLAQASIPAADRFLGVKHMRVRDTPVGMRWVSVEVGVFILSLAFLLSLYFPEIRDQPWRIIIMLEASPTAYLVLSKSILLRSVLPIVLGLTFSVIGYIREIRSPTGVLGWSLPLAVFGFFFFIWGAWGLHHYYNSYFHALVEAELSPFGSAYVRNSIVIVYATAYVARIIWLFTGVLFMLSPVFKIIIRRKYTQEQARV